MNKIKDIYNNINNKLPPGFKKVFSNVSWQVGGHFTKMFMVLIIGVIVARYLGPENYGILNYVLAIVGIYMVFTKLGMDGIIVRELINNPDKQSEILSTGFIIKIIGAFLSIFLTIGTLYFFNSDQQIVLIIGLIASSIFIFSTLEIIDLLFQAKLLNKHTVIAKNIGVIVGGLFKIYGVINGYDLVYFVICNALDSLFMFSMLLYYFYKKTPTHKLSIKLFDKSIAKQLFKDCRPLILSSISVVLYMRIDQVMIKNMLSDYELGIYSAAVRIAEIPNFLSMVMATSFFPAILAYRKTNYKLYERRLGQMYSLFYLVSIGIAVITTILSPIIIGILYGNDYNSSSLVLSIYIWSIIPVFLGVASSKYLITENLSKISFYRTLIGAITNIILNIILIPQMGIIGACIATIISYTIATYSMVLFKKSRRNGFEMIFINLKNK